MKGHQVFSRSLSGGSRIVRAINDKLLIQRDPTHSGLIEIVEGDLTFDVQISTVLDIGDKVKVATREGPLKVGDHVMSVRVVNKKVEDIDMRSKDGEKISLCPGEHAIAVVTDGAILPCNNLMLVQGQPDRRDFGGITVQQDTKLGVFSHKILATGPDVTLAEVGEYAVAPSIHGVSIDSFEIRKRFGSNLKLIREVSVQAISTEVVEGEFSPERLPDDRKFRLL